MAVTNKAEEMSPLSKFMGLVANGNWDKIFPEAFWDEAQALMDHAVKYPLVVYNEPPLDLALNDDGTLHRVYSNNDFYVEFDNYSRASAFSVSISGEWADRAFIEMEFDWDPEIEILELALSKVDDNGSEYLDEKSNEDDDLRSLLEWGLTRIADWLVIQVAARDY